LIYFAQTPTGSIKIGTSENVDSRLLSLEQHYGQPLALIGTMPGDRQTEQEIHARFSHLRLGRTEQFRPAADLMEFIGKPLLVGPNPDAFECVPSLIAVTLRGSQEWKTWIEAGAKFCRTDVAKLIDSAVVDYLRARGFTQEAPER
jgi:T5orf172 domain